MKIMQVFRALGFALCLVSDLAWSEHMAPDYQIGAGDLVRIVVFQNPDLTLETRVAESGMVTYPLIGGIRLGGQTLDTAAKIIAEALKQGGFVQQPQVNVNLLANRGNQVSVLGQVNRPGRFPLETFNTRVSEILATAGGIAANGADKVILQGMRNGKSFRREIDIPNLFLSGDSAADVIVQAGDSVYVHRAPVFYIYGEAQRPGMYKLEREMTIQQGLAVGGGPTVRGTELWIRLHRKSADGKIDILSPERTDALQADDVLYIRESLF